MAWVMRIDGRTSVEQAQQRLAHCRVVVLIQYKLHGLIDLEVKYVQRFIH